MISHNLVRNKLYEEFIKPTNQVKNFIGIEIEIPIINLNKQAVDFDVVHNVTSKFQNQYDNFKEDGIDYSVGIWLEKKMGDKGNNGDILAYIHANDEEKGKQAVEELKQAYKIVENPVKKEEHILGII